MGILYCFSLFLPIPHCSFLLLPSRLHLAFSTLVRISPLLCFTHIAVQICIVSLCPFFSRFWVCLGFSEVSAQLLSSQAPTSEPANEPLNRQFGQRVTKGLGPDLFWQEIWHFAGEFPNYYEKSQSLRTS